MTDVRHLALKPERAVEEDCFEQIQQLNLNDILPISDSLFQHFKQIIEYEIYEPLTEVWSVDVAKETLQKLY